MSKVIQIKICQITNKYILWFLWFFIMQKISRLISTRLLVKLQCLEK